MSDPAVLCHVDARGIARLTLNRTDRHNAFDDGLIDMLTGILNDLEGDGAVRAVLLGAAGRSFCAGADLGWMKRMAAYSHAENLADSRKLAALMRTLNFLRKPTVALVHGAAFGGGVGLVACCDIALATPRARFCLSEVKLGLIPAVIGPYVVDAMGARAARRYFTTAEAFDAREAHRLGLVHEITAEDRLQTRAGELIDVLLGNGPAAMAAAKTLIHAVAGAPVTDAVIADTAARIAERRASEEAREGMTAFFEKRPPVWARGEG